MDKNLLENRKDDWLAQEYKRENLRNNLDLDDAKKLKDEHYREHKGKNEVDIEENIGIVLCVILVSMFLCLAGGLLYAMFMFLASPWF